MTPGYRPSAGIISHRSLNFNQKKLKILRKWYPEFMRMNYYREWSRGFDGVIVIFHRKLRLFSYKNNLGKVQF